MDQGEKKRPTQNKQYKLQSERGQPMPQRWVDEPSKGDIVVLLEQKPQLLSLDYGYMMEEQKLFYEPKSTDMPNTNITQLNKAKLKKWLAQEMSRNFYCRETYALASRYLDIFLNNQMNIKLQSLQSLGLACFLVAAKVHQNRLPAISYDIFDKREILQLEQQILFSFQFKLRPLTYVTVTETLLQFYRIYCEGNQSQFSLNYFQKSDNSVLKFRSIMEILDCIYLVAHNNTFSSPSLVLLVFFFENRINCLHSPYPPTLKDAIELWETFDDYKQNFTQFLQYLMEQCLIFSEVQIDVNLMEFVFPFFALKTRERNAVESPFPLRPAHTVMTYNSGAYGLARKIMNK